MARVTSKVAFSKSLGTWRSPLKPPEAPRPPGGIEPPQAGGPSGQKPQKAKRNYFPGGPQRVSDPGFRVLASVDGQACAGCLALSSMGSMATAIRKSTMRCWGPRGPHSTTLQRRHPLFSPRDGVCLCRVSSGCWPPRNGWETA